MKSNIATTPEQSEHLIELGLSPDTADMCWTNHHFGDLMGYTRLESTPPNEYRNMLKSFHVGSSVMVEPAWSLDALLELMPQSISKWCNSNNSRRCYDLNLFRSYYHCCSYSYGPSLKEENHDNLHCYGSETSWIDAVYNMAVWLIENGYWKPNEGKKDEQTGTKDN